MMRTFPAINDLTEAIIGAAYGSAGERCMAISVLTSVGSIADTVIDAIADRLPKVKVGPGMDPESEMGPLITREHRDKVASYLDSGPAQGARIVTDAPSSPSLALRRRT